MFDFADLKWSTRAPDTTESVAQSSEVCRFRSKNLTNEAPSTLLITVLDITGLKLDSPHLLLQKMKTLESLGQVRVHNREKAAPPMGTQLVAYRDLESDKIEGV